MSTSDLAHRLRTLRDRRGWTVADMAERTGIPKRTLDKYMLRSGAILPGYEALLALSKGLGVSLDWLVFGAEFASEGSELLATMAATEVSQSYFETVLAHLNSSGAVVDGDLLLGLTPEEWGADVGWTVGERARELASSGITVEELLNWKAARQERQSELMKDRFDRLKRTAKVARSDV